jgi:hypothetical protein
MSDPAILPAMRALLSCPGITHREVAIAAAREALAPLRELHKAFGVYGDDCDHELDTGDDKHRYVEEFGWTCDYMYDICIECCTTSGYQTEDCATYHDHGPGKPICATAKLIYPSEEL